MLLLNEDVGRWACNNSWVVCGHPHGLFLSIFHSCYESSRSFESDGQRQTIYLFWHYFYLFWEILSPLYQPYTTFYSALREVSSRYWPCALLSGRPIVWDTRRGGHSQLGWAWPFSNVLHWTRQFHTRGSKRLNELFKKPVEFERAQPRKAVKEQFESLKCQQD